MPSGNHRLEREKRTIRVMIELYCRKYHTGGSCPCPECALLLDYAVERIEKCCFHDDKPTCADCTVHCYKPAMREQVRAIMRYAGPRMLLRHPVLALMHVWDGRHRKHAKVGARSPRPRSKS